jgi:polygalacturonase
MAITQISRIQHRRGLRESLPQLAAGEIGFAVDTQELFIGNGTISDGAPQTGNTKILTEDDNILSVANTYTFRGNTDSPVVTGVDNNSPVVRTLQKKLDDFANVKDFGAVGDGSTDDTAAINRAIANLMTVETTGKQKRRLYFPGGVYIITGPILLYPFSNLVGDGMESTIIRQTDATEECVMRTCDSNIQLQTQSDNHILIIDSGVDMHIQNTHFKGNFTNQDGATNGKACVDIRGTLANKSSRIFFVSCAFEKSEYGINSNFDCQDVLITGCEFDSLHRGLNLAETADGSTGGQVTGPTGVLVEGNRFDNIDVEGIFIHSNGGRPEGNIVAGNSFRDVGANSDDSADVPAINFEHGNNFAYGNFFHRTDTLSNFDGSVYHETPIKNALTLDDNASTFRNALDPFTNNAVQYDNQRETHIEIDYCIVRDTAKRRGTLTVESTPTNVVFSDEFVENASTGVTLKVDAAGILQYKTTSTGSTASMKYRFKVFT